MRLQTLKTMRKLLFFIRYRTPEKFAEEMLFCKPLGTRATGKEVFNKVDQFLEQHELSWENCVSVCCDGAPSMMGTKRVQNF